MSKWIQSDWNLRPQRQQEEQNEDERNKSSNMHKQLLINPTFAMSNHDVTEITWENGQLAVNSLGGIHNPAASLSSDTLESIVHQATCYRYTQNNSDQQDQPYICSHVASSSLKRNDSPGHVQMAPNLSNKRPRLGSDECEGKSSRSKGQEEAYHERSACASVTATMNKDKDTIMTWPSFDSPNWSLKSKTNNDYSPCQDGSENQEEECKTKGETISYHSSQRNRSADVHNQAERRRRDKINQKMKALQKLVPNASKTDKASMLDEVIEYLKHLQAQIQIMSSMRNIPQMMMPIQLQQQAQLQMAMMARMGMGVGLGMGMMPQSIPQQLIHQTPVASSTSTFVPPPFMAPHMIGPRHLLPEMRHDVPATNPSVPFSDPYGAFLAQSMNIDLYNKMSVLYQQQVSQAMTKPSQSNHGTKE